MADMACGRCRVATAKYVAMGNVPEHAHVCRLCYGELSPEFQAHYVSMREPDPILEVAWTMAKGTRYYGPRTEAATMEVQRLHGLAVDGIAGYHTFTVTNFPKPWPMLPPVLRKGDYGEAVARWQDHIGIQEFLGEP